MTKCNYFSDSLSCCCSIGTTYRFNRELTIPCETFQNTLLAFEKKRQKQFLKPKPKTNQFTFVDLSTIVISSSQ